MPRHFFSPLHPLRSLHTLHLKIMFLLLKLLPVCLRGILRGEVRSLRLALTAEEIFMDCLFEGSIVFVYLMRVLHGEFVLIVAIDEMGDGLWYADCVLRLLSSLGVEARLAAFVVEKVDQLGFDWGAVRC
jgi:hypothetical protein